MEQITLTQSEISAFKIPFIKPFVFAGNTVSERTGYYLTITTSTGLSAKGEIAPLPGMSSETLRRANHDIQEVRSYLAQLTLPTDFKSLVDFLSKEPHIFNLCPSARFGVESALFSLAAQAQGKTLVEFIGGSICDVPTAGLLQGTAEQVVADAKRLMGLGYKTLKLKVGDRNIAMDVKKVQDIRTFMEWDVMLRLDGNRVWSFKEAVLFAELAGRKGIEFIEEPLSDMGRLEEFYRQTQMPIALDETLSVIRTNVQAPGRCMPTLANQDGVKAYVIKPMIIGGIIPALNWIEEARRNGKKSIISSSFESTVGLKVLASLSCLSGQAAGLGTERWFKNIQPLVTESGIIPSSAFQN